MNCSEASQGSNSPDLFIRLSFGILFVEFFVIALPEETGYPSMILGSFEISLKLSLVTNY